MQRLPTFIPDVFHLQPERPCRHNPTESLKRQKWQAFLIHLSFWMALYSHKGFLLIGWVLVDTSWSQCGPYTNKSRNGWLSSFKIIMLSWSISRTIKSQNQKKLSKYRDIYIIDWAVFIGKRVIEHIYLRMGWNTSFRKHFILSNTDSLHGSLMTKNKEL